MILKNKLAKDFFNKALKEFEKESKPTLSKKCGGYWLENNLWIAFDNYGHELTVEEFKDKTEAVKYAKGIMAITKSGFEI